MFEKNDSQVYHQNDKLEIQSSYARVGKASSRGCLTYTSGSRQILLRIERIERIQWISKLQSLKVALTRGAK